MTGHSETRGTAAAALLLFCLPTLTLSAPAQESASDEEAEAKLLADLKAFVDWFRAYQAGTERMVSDLEPDREALARAEQIMRTLAQHGSKAIAERLFEAAIVDPEPPGTRVSTDRIDFHAELLPWRIRRIAREQIAAIDDPAVEKWLIGMLHDRALRAKEGDAQRRRADGAIQILGLSKSPTAQQAVLEATSRLPERLRVRALDVLAANASLAVVPVFIDRLRDREANMRITALNAIGIGLGPHTDETEHDTIDPDVVIQRDTAIAAIEKILERDKVWQVRAAATNALLALRSREAIPALIDGLDAELERKKDPWAMDVRLHRALEQLTGQNVPQGDSRAWKAFWKAEKGRFRLAKPDQLGQKQAESSEGVKYEKFFNLNIESDRVLFVVDFSGSMQESITLQAETTATKSGQSIQKAKLVVEEMKRIIMSLPDGARFNVIVFSDDVRVWRGDEKGKPLAVELDDETRDDLLGSFLDNLSPAGATNLHGAMDRALGFDAPGVVADKRYGPGFDTIYVLSDGAPTIGSVTDKEEIRRLVRETNSFSQLTIHCVTFGELNDVAFLRDLAEENGGRHIHVE